MLTGFRVENFKAFRDTASDGVPFIELKPITLLAGVNSAGKSSLTQALLLLKQTLESGSTQILVPDGNLVSLGRFEDFLFGSPGIVGQEDVDTPPPTLTYHLTFAYEEAEGSRLQDELMASLPITEADIQVESLSYELVFTFVWGTFGYRYLKRPVVRLNSLQLKFLGNQRTFLGLEIRPGERDESAYQVHLMEEDTDPMLQGFAFDQLRAERLSHFLPDLLTVSHGPQLDLFRALPSAFASFLRMLLESVQRDLSERLSYLSSFREPPQSVYSNVQVADRLNPYGSNCAQVLWYFREMPVRFRHPDVPYPRGSPYELSLSQMVEWVLENILGLDQPLQIQPVREAKDDVLEIRAETLGPKPTAIGLAALGLGYNQILPVVIQGLMTPPGGLVIFEQPEIHLHPKIQARLIDFFVGLAQAGRRVLVETHSSHMVEHLSLAIAKDRTYQLEENAQVLFVHPPDREHLSARIEPVRISRYGEILNWPSHFLPDTAALYESILKEGFAKRREEKEHGE